MAEKNKNQKNMKKKIALGLIALVAVVGGVAAMSAYEAHVINVTAHIENALEVHDDIVPFGTVFPQEYTERQFTVKLSTSFGEQARLDDVTYVIKQKPKPTAELITYFEDDEVAAREYCHTNGAGAVVPGTSIRGCYLDLCRFLSKLNDDMDGTYPDGTPMPENDTSHASYYIDPDNDPANPDGDEYCESVDPADASGKLMQSTGDNSDLWILDLKVPPVAGYVGQDWPSPCWEDLVVEADEEDYGCDLWIEVTGFSPWLK
jgi:hypothetical protein